MDKNPASKSLIVHTVNRCKQAERETFRLMIGNYKIQKDKVKLIVHQDLKYISMISLISILFPFITLSIMMHKEDMPIYILILSMIFSLTLIFVIIAYMYNFKIVYYEAYTLIITEKGLHKKIDIDNNKKVTGLRAWAWHKQKILSKQHDTFVEWNKIKEVKRLKRGMLIKAKYADFYGYGVIVIPNGIENFDMIQKFIEVKINNN